MKKKKLITIGASSLMLLNTGLMPVVSLAEEKTADTEEVAPEQADKLTTDSLPEAAPELTQEPVQETPEATTSSATTEESEATTEESTTDNEQKADSGSLIQPMDIGLIAWGKIGLKLLQTKN